MAKLPTPTYEQAWAAYHKAREAFTAADLTYLDARKAFAQNALAHGAGDALVAARKARDEADALLRAAETLLQGR